MDVAFAAAEAIGDCLDTQLGIRQVLLDKVLNLKTQGFTHRGEGRLVAGFGQGHPQQVYRNAPQFGAGSVRDLIDFREQAVEVGRHHAINPPTETEAPRGQLADFAPSQTQLRRGTSITN